MKKVKADVRPKSPEAWEAWTEATAAAAMLGSALARFENAISTLSKYPEFSGHHQAAPR